MGKVAGVSIWIAPLPERARTTYNLLRALIDRGTPVVELQMAMQRINDEEQARAVEQRVAELTGKTIVIRCITCPHQRGRTCNHPELNRPLSLVRTGDTQPVWCPLGDRVDA